MNFIQQAYKGYTDWWRFFITLVITFLGWQLIGAIPIAVAAIMKSDNITIFQKAAEDNFMSLGIESNLYLFLMLIMFVFGLAALFLGTKVVHKRSVLSLTTSRTQFDWKRFFYAFILWTIVSLFFMAVDYFMHPQDFVWNFKPSAFLVLVIISIVFIPVQTSFEEILFRGYLMQNLGIFTRTRWFPLLFTSVAFGLLHGFNPEVDKLGKEILFYYIGTGLLFGVITLLDEGLELSLGLHAANNIVAAIFVTTNWTVFQTHALWIDTSEPSLGMMMYIPLFVIYPLVLLILTRKYKWVEWKEKLFGKIDKPSEIDEIGI